MEHLSAWCGKNAGFLMLDLAVFKKVKYFFVSLHTCLCKWVCLCIFVCVAHASAKSLFFARVFLKINSTEIMNSIIYYDTFTNMDSIFFPTLYWRRIVIAVWIKELPNDKIAKHGLISARQNRWLYPSNHTTTQKLRAMYGKTSQDTQPFKTSCFRNLVLSLALSVTFSFRCIFRSDHISRARLVWHGPFKCLLIEIEVWRP